MNAWMTLRTGAAVFVALVGIGLMFVRSEDTRLVIGAFLAAIGLTFLLRVAIALRRL
jgi:hypothetical protein